MKAAIVINPVSGTRRRGPDHLRRAEALVARIARAHSADAAVVPTRGPRHAGELTRDAIASGAELVVAWGGDGTVNEVAAAVAFTGAALGIVPAGSGNGLARACRVPFDPAAALALALESPPWRIDVGEIGGRLFVNVAGVGFDAHVARVFNAGGRRGLGRYVRVAIRELRRYRPRPYVWEDGGERRERVALIVAFANSPQYGNGAVIAPGARLDDGQLDMVVAGATSPARDLWRARRLFTGTLAEDPHAEIHRIGATRITARDPILFHVDGEPVLGGSSLEVRVHPQALWLRAPRA